MRVRTDLALTIGPEHKTCKGWVPRAGKVPGPTLRPWLSLKSAGLPCPRRGCDPRWALRHSHRNIFIPGRGVTATRIPPKDESGVRLPSPRPRAGGEGGSSPSPKRKSQVRLLAGLPSEA